MQQGIKCGQAYKNKLIAESHCTTTVARLALESDMVMGKTVNPRLPRIYRGKWGQNHGNTAVTVM